MRSRSRGEEPRRIRYVAGIIHSEPSTIFPGGEEFVGVELNPWLVLYSRLASLRSLGPRSPVRFRRQDLWKYSLDKHDTVVVFGVECMMQELQGKCERELGTGSTVVACRFPFEAWKPARIVGEGVDTVWLYER